MTQELGDLGKGVGVQVKCQREDIFDMMHAKGLYPTPAADEKKVQEAKQQYCQCAK